MQKNFKTTDEFSVPEKIAELLEVPIDIVTNCNIHTVHNNSIHIFGDRIIEGMKNNKGYYILISRFYKKPGEVRKYMYDVDNMVAAYIKPALLSNIVLEQNVGGNTDILVNARYKFDLSVLGKFNKESTAHVVDLFESEEVRELRSVAGYAVGQLEIPFPDSNDIAVPGKYDSSNVPDDDLDRPADKFTKRELACILLGVPASKNKALDTLITQALKQHGDE